MPSLDQELNPSRTAISTRQDCTRERFYGYDFQDGGLAKKGAKYEADFGSLVHSALAECLQQKKAIAPFKEEMKLCELIDVQFAGLDDEDRDHMKREQSWLLAVLVVGWCRLHLANVLRNFEILSVEVETSVLFEPSKYLPGSVGEMMRPLRLPLRLDALLQEKITGAILIMDFKTASMASEDWEQSLNHSIQSDLYIEAIETLYPGDFCAGIFYQGLVKGKRQLDTAKSSPFNGQIIQYGSFLYGWQSAAGKIVPQSGYAAGSKRVFLPDALGVNTVAQFMDAMTERGVNFSAYFPSTIPWKPLNIGMAVGQIIVNENDYARAVELYNSAPEGSAEKILYENVLFEQTKSRCLKYGSKHACQFNDICNKGIEQWEIDRLYEKRIDHHSTD